MALNRDRVREAQGGPLAALRRFLQQSDIIQNHASHPLLLITFWLQIMSFKRQGVEPQFKKMVLVSAFVTQTLTIGIASFFSTLEIVGLNVFLETMELEVFQYESLYTILEQEDQLSF